mgnify:CR=1 FL=1
MPDGGSEEFLPKPADPVIAEERRRIGLLFQKSFFIFEKLSGFFLKRKNQVPDGLQVFAEVAGDLFSGVLRRRGKAKMSRDFAGQGRQGGAGAPVRGLLQRPTVGVVTG